MTTLPGHRALRKGCVSLPGQIYLLTTVTAQRRALFSNERSARIVAHCCIDDAYWGDARLLCWVLMPDHWHGLVELGRHDDLSTIMHRFKAVTTRRLHGTQTGLVWSRGFHDRALGRDEDVRVVARYIVANPLRAGLVQNVLDYPYWHCVWL